MEKKQTERENRREKIRSGKRRKIAAAVMFGALFVIAVMLLVLLVQSVVALIKGTAGNAPEATDEAPAQTTPADPGLVYGPLAEDLSAVLSPRRSYDYSKPVPEIAAVDDSYFIDSLVIGDSRSQGFSLYGVMGNAEILASGSVNITGVLERSFEYADGTATLAQRLEAKPFSSIYISLGLNELGWEYPDMFIDAYASLIDAIRAKQPLADIYIESIIPLSAEKSASADYFSKERVGQYNTKLLALAQQKQVYYLSVEDVFIDGSGYMKSEATSDGINPARDYFNIWYDYIKTHTVSKEYYGN